MRKTPYLVSLLVVFITLTLTIVSIALPKWLRVPSSNRSPDASYIGLYEICELRRTSPAPPYPDPSPLPDPTLPPPPGSSPEPIPEPQSISDLLFFERLRHGQPQPAPVPPISDPSRPSNPIPPPPKSPTPRHKKHPKYKCRPFPSRTLCDHDGQSFCVLWSTVGYAMQLSILFAVVTLIVLGIVSFGFSTRARRRGAWKIVGALTGVQVALQIAAMSIIVYLKQHRTSRFSPNTQYGASFILLIISWCTGVFVVVGLVGTGFAAHAGHKWAAGKRGYHSIPDAH